MCAMVGGSQISFANRKSAKLLTYQFFLLQTLQFADMRFRDRRFAGPIILQTSAKPGKKNILNLYVSVGLK
jgi:hypothetical protein